MLDTMSVEEQQDFFKVPDVIVENMNF